MSGPVALLQPVSVCSVVWLQIVAGLEPENTNVFLQMMGRAARMGAATSAVQVRRRRASQQPRAVHTCVSLH